MCSVPVMLAVIRHPEGARVGRRDSRLRGNDGRLHRIVICSNCRMPPKIRELLKDLEAAGFVNRGGKGSHRNFKHPQGVRITISGRLGSDAQAYQERDVKRAVDRVRHEKE